MWLRALRPANAPRMKLHGTIAANLRAAVTSAVRLRSNHVYQETLTYWRELLHEARRARGEMVSNERDALDALIEQLELELAERPAHR
jgi:hypothetical protein